LKANQILFIVLTLCISSCNQNNVKPTPVREIKVTDTFTKTSPSYKVNVTKVDSLVEYLTPENYHKLRYQRLYEKYTPNDHFETKLVPLGSGEMFIQSASVEHKRFRFPEKNNYQGYIVKKLTQNYRDVYAQGNGHIKTSIQIFPVSQEGKIEKKSLHQVKAYGNVVDIFFNEGYFLGTQYSCCLSTNTYELFDLNGKLLVSANDYIKSIKTKKTHYFIGVLKDEITDIPVLFIKEVDGNTQYINFSPINFDNIHGEHFYIKFKDQKSPYIAKSASTFSEYEVEHLNDVEIWLPFNKKDTLKIPFKNEKVFGVDYPQIKVTFQEKKLSSN